MEFHGISVVSEETGIHESSLRRWEEMGLIAPARVDLGKTTVRVYTADDLALLGRAKELMDGGYKLRKALEIAKLEAKIEAEEDGDFEDE
jgi:MerR family transcriptional regulator, heat shock protein HspR